MMDYIQKKINKKIVSVVKTMNVFQKFLILGIVLLLVGTNLNSLVESTRQETFIIFDTKSAPSGVNVTLNGTMGENGWYVSCVYIQISFGPDVVSFWYQFNGGHWKLYTEPFGPICEDGVYTFCWFYVDNEGNQSVVECIEFKIDQTPPMTAHEFDGVIGENGWFVSDVTITLTAEDETSGVDYTMYKLDDDEWINYTNPFVVTEDGEHILYYYSVDLAGNEEDVNEADFKIDYSPPIILIITMDGVLGDNEWYISDVTITIELTGDIPCYIMFLLDDGEWLMYTGPFVVYEDGEHFIKAFGVDPHGSHYDARAEFKIDKTPPTIWLTVEKIDFNTWMITADISDETSGIAKVEFYANGEYLGEVTEYPYEWIYNATFSTGFSVKGLILNPKFTEETVSFFAVIAIGRNWCSTPDCPNAQAIAYDNAGNLKISPEPCSSIDNELYLYVFEQLTFPNNYSGHIGKLFINAVFEDGPI